MARLIKKAEVKVIVKKLSDIYEMGETVSFDKVLPDRSESVEVIGDIVKINKSTVDVKIYGGDIYRVHRDELN